MIDLRRIIFSSAINLAFPALLAIALFAEHAGVDGSEKPPAVHIPTSGRVRAIVAFVRFRDDEVAATGCRTRAQREWSDLDALPDVAHHVLSPTAETPFADSTLTAYLYQQSRGSFVLEGESYPHLIVTRREEGAYGTGSSRVLDRDQVELDRHPPTGTTGTARLPHVLRNEQRIVKVFGAHVHFQTVAPDRSSALEFERRHAYALVVKSTQRVFNA